MTANGKKGIWRVSQVRASQESVWVRILTAVWTTPKSYSLQKKKIFSWSCQSPIGLRRAGFDLLSFRNWGLPVYQRSMANSRWRISDLVASNSLGPCRLPPGPPYGVGHRRGNVSQLQSCRWQIRSDLLPFSPYPTALELSNMGLDNCSED